MSVSLSVLHLLLQVLASMSNKKNLPEVTTNIPQTAVSSIPEKHLRFSDPSGNSDNMMEAMSIGEMII